MKDKKKMIIVLVILLVAGGGYKYKFMGKKGGPVAVKKVDGALVPLTPEFVVNLSGDHFGKVSVTLVLPKAPPASAEGGGGLPEENAAVRAVITDQLTGASPSDLVNRDKREVLVKSIKIALKKKTDEEVKDVLLTDIAVE